MNKFFAWMFAISFIALANPLLAQNNITTGTTTSCYYKDYIPDVQIIAPIPTGNDTTVIDTSVDITGDGYADIKFECRYSIASGLQSNSVKTLSNEIQIAGKGTGNITVTDLPTGVIIPDNLATYSSTWHTGELYFNLYGGGNNISEWDDAGFGYMGFKAKDASDSTYGWVRMLVTSSSGIPTITAFDYAIKFVLNIGFSDPQVSSVSIFPNPSSGLFVIKSSVPITDVKMMDVQGREVKAPVLSSQNFMEIDASQLPAGAYLLIINGLVSQTAIKY